MTVIRWSPLLEDFRHLQRSLDRVFEGELGRLSEPEEPRTWSHAVDVFESVDSVVFEVEVPGFEKDEISISIDNGTLSVSGEKRLPDSQERELLRRERRYGKIFRSFRLPSAVNPEKISANLKNGVLTVSLAKREESKPREIPVVVQ